jgi:hypothetical protein
MVRRIALRISLVLLSLSISVASLAAAHDQKDQKAAGDSFVGTWAGKWEGGGSSGNIEVAISKDSEKLVGKVSANTDNGDYNAAFKSLAFDGNKMTAVYDLPLMDNVEITLISTFDGNSTRGTWSAHEKGQTTEIIGGPWTATRK